MIEPNVAARQTPMAQHDSVGRYRVGARSERAQRVTPDIRGRRPRNFKDDHEILRHGMVMYDALYTWCKNGMQEAHTWNPQADR